MAVRLHRGSSYIVNVVKLMSDKEIPITDSAVMSLTPLFIDIELDNPELEKQKNYLENQFSLVKSTKEQAHIKKELSKVIDELALLSKLSIRLSIKQLTQREYSELFYYINIIKQIIEKSDKGLVDKSETIFIPFLSFYLSKLISCETPQYLLSKEAISILNSNNIKLIPFKCVKSMLKEVLTLDDRFAIKDLQVYRSMNTIKKFFIINFIERNTLKQLAKQLVERLLASEIYELLQNMSFDKVIWIAQQVINYNDAPVKKKLFPS